MQIEDVNKWVKRARQITSYAVRYKQMIEELSSQNPQLAQQWLDEDENILLDWKLLTPEKTALFAQRHKELKSITGKSIEWIE